MDTEANHLITIGGMNLTDEEPPKVFTNSGYDSRVHDPRGRQLHVRLALIFQVMTIYFDHLGRWVTHCTCHPREYFTSLSFDCFADESCIDEFRQVAKLLTCLWYAIPTLPDRRSFLELIKQPCPADVFLFWLWRHLLLLSTDQWIQ